MSLPKFRPTIDVSSFIDTLSRNFSGVLSINSRPTKISQQIKILRLINISRPIKNDMRNLSAQSRSFSGTRCSVNIRTRGGRGRG